MEAKDILQHYVDMSKRDIDEFVAHYNAISAVGGFRIPEDHVVALVETMGADTWGVAAKKFTNHLIASNVAALAWLIGCMKLTSWGPQAALAGMLMIYIGVTIAWAINTWLLQTGATELLSRRSSVMRAYLETSFERVEARMRDEKEELDD